MDLTLPDHHSSSQITAPQNLSLDRSEQRKESIDGAKSDRSVDTTTTLELTMDGVVDGGSGSSHGKKSDDASSMDPSEVLSEDTLLVQQSGRMGSDASGCMNED